MVGMMYRALLELLVLPVVTLAKMNEYCFIKLLNCKSQLPWSLCMMSRHKTPNKVEVFFKSEVSFFI